MTMMNAIGRLGHHIRTAHRRLTSMVPAKLLGLTKIAAVFALILALSVIAIDLTRQASRISAIWPVNAVFLVILLKHRRNEWPALFAAFAAGLLSANLLSSYDGVRAVLFSSANVFEVTLVAAVFAYGHRPRLSSTKGVLRLFFAAILGSCVSSSIIASGLLGLGSALKTEDVALWFAANAIGYMLVAPLLSALISKRRRYEGESKPFESAWQLGLLGLTTLVVFEQSELPLLFLVSPAVLWLAFSGGAKRAALGIVLIAAISLPLTMEQRGPIALIGASLVTHVLILQLFLATNTVLSLAVGAAMTQRQRLMAQLQLSQARLKATLQNQKEMLGKAQLAEEISGVGHWSLDVDTQLVYWSPEVYAIHGVTRDSFDPRYADAVAFYVQEDRKRVQDLISAALLSGDGWEIEATLVRSSDGAHRRVSAVGRCLKDEAGVVRRVFGVFQDITDQKKMYHELERREYHYRLLADYSTDIIVQFGVDGKIIYASPSGRIVGIDPEKAVGMSLIDFVIDEDKPLSAALTKDLFSGEEPDRSIRREFRVPVASGNIIWLEGSPQIIRGPDGRPSSIISTYRDVTERKEREEALASARCDAEAAAKAKAEFLSNMSHEIRTPLNGVLGFTQLIQQTGLSVEQKHFVDRIAGAGRMLRDIVDDILDFSKIDAGKMEVETRQFNLSDVIHEVVELVDAARPDKSVPIICTLPPGEDLRLVGDETRVRQILTNIVGNAAKFTRAGLIQVSADRTGSNLELSVRDTGPGIAESQLEAVFQGFHQADSTVTRRFGGTGLGLSISRSLARLMGGDIRIESKEGQGTLVRILLPERVHAVVQQTDSPQADEVRGQRSARIMVVDDVEINLELVKLGLTAAGHQVTAFISAETAIQSLEAGDLYDIVLMDVQMPGMDGPTAARRIRAMHGPASVLPIVALTAHAVPSDVSAFLAAGMTAHFSKPVDLDKLNQLVLQLVSARVNAPPLNASPPLDPIAKLRVEYREYLSTVAGELDKIMQLTDDTSVLGSVGALAHAIAGTAGSLGYPDVSAVAFELEAASKTARRTGVASNALQPEIDRFLKTVSQASSELAVR